MTRLEQLGRSESVGPSEPVGGSAAGSVAAVRSFGPLGAWMAYADDASVVLVPLRAFLGFTFCFAGLQKIADPNFFRAANPTSIQSQLRAAARTSPLHGLLQHLVHVATPLGVLIALSELAVGLGVLAGVFTRVAAVGGMLISFSLFLTVSFHSKPYYTGADIGYVFAFAPLLIAGAGRYRLSLLVDRLASAGYQSGGGVARGARAARPAIDQGRREMLFAGALGAAGLTLAGLVAVIGRLAGGSKAPAAGTSLGGTGKSVSTSTTVARTGTTAVTPTTVSGLPSGTKLGAASVVPVGGSASFQDPSSGDPGLVIQAQAGQFVAFDAVCPHAGCTVSYSSSQKVIVCPCHSSLFNAATGAVEQGPAASNLRSIKISEGSDGQLYVD